MFVPCSSEKDSWRESMVMAFYVMISKIKILLQQCDLDHLVLTSIKSALRLQLILIKQDVKISTIVGSIHTHFVHSISILWSITLVWYMLNQCAYFWTGCLMTKLHLIQLHTMSNTSHFCQQAPVTIKVNWFRLFQHDQR